MLEDLVKTLSSVGKPTELYQSPDGTRVLILPHGGRILGLYSAESGENFLWVHSALASVESARAFYAGDQWHNSGGDRTWLAPEVDIFFPNFPKLDKYWQPRELDPGNYNVVRTEDGIRLVNRLALTLSRSKQTVELEMTKSVTPALSPLRYEPGLKNLPGVQYAGYALETTLEFVGPNREQQARVGLWNLLQMPHGGDLVVPTYVRAEPKIYMGTIGPEDLIVDEHLVRYKMRAKGEHKIGIRAVATTGRVGYIYSTGGQLALIIRNFVVDPSGEYVDVPWAETENLGYSTQACNVHSGLGSFSELEYHIPAIGLGTGRARSEDVSQVWAFRGPRENIQAIARSLLSPHV